MSTWFLLFVWLSLASLDVIDPVSYGSAATTTAPVTEVSAAREYVAFFGDLLLARDVERNQKRYGAGYPFTIFQDVSTEQYAAMFANFEAAVPTVHQPTPDNHTRFSVASSGVRSLVNTPITHVSLANNHAYDFGPTGYSHTVRSLESRSIEVFGHPHQITSSSVTYIQTDAVDLSVIAVQAVTAVPSPETYEPLLARMRQQSHVQVAYVHFGTEYRKKNSALQQRVAYDLIDRGVDLVVGHHPHVVQNFAKYRNKLIIYSVGNFIFDQYFSRAVQRGLWLDVSHTNQLLTVELRPVTSVDSYSQPRFMSDTAAAQFLRAIAARSDTTLSTGITTGVITVPLASSTKHATIETQ